MGYNLLNLATENLTKGIVKCFSDEAVLFEAVPVLNITGNSIAYNRVNEMFEVEKRELGQDIIHVNELTTEKVVEPLEIFSTSAKVDRAMCMMANDDLLAIETEIQAKSMGRAVHKSILEKVKSVAGVKVAPKGAIPTAEEVAEAMDNMRFVEGQMIMITNAKTNRSLQKEAVLGGFTYGQADAFGRRMYQFNGVPVEVSQDLKDGEVLIMYLNTAEGVCLSTNGGVKAYDLGLKGVFYTTDMELLASVVVKNTKAVAYVGK